MRFQYYLDDISLTPFWGDLQGYGLESLRRDAYAGLSVALLTIPQAMAYAMLAGLPLYCGLFAAIYSSIMAAAFGSSRHLVVGPSNSIAILVQSGTSEILFTYYREAVGFEREMLALQILTQLCLLVGLIQIFAAGCKLGRLTQFVSHSVIIGYIAGTAIAVIVNQLFTFLGLTRVSGVFSLYERGVYIFTHLHKVHIPTVLIGVGTMGILFFLKRMNKHIPAAVIAFFVMALIVHFFDLSSYGNGGEVDPYFEDHVQKVMLVGDTAGEFEVIPKVEWPSFNTRIMNSLLPMAFALALLGVMESTSVAKSIAANSGQRLSVNQEIFGLGMGNLTSAFLTGMPVTGSPSRTFFSYSNGAQTRFAAIINAVVVAAFLLSFGYVVTMIPEAALSALLLYTAVNIVNPKQFFLCLKATSSDAFVLWLTLLSCIFFSLDIAFYIGTALSITLYLKKAAVPQLVEYDIDEAGELKRADYSHQHEHKDIRVIKVEGELFFGAADIFQNTLKTMAEDDTSTKVIILQLKNARDIDATGCLAVQQLYEYLKVSGRHLLLCGLTFQIWEVLSDAGLVEQVGKENMFIFDERNPHHYLHKAYGRARELAVQAMPHAVEPADLPEPALVSVEEMGT
jgi:SulP family sulfate permease